MSKDEIEKPAQTESSALDVFYEKGSSYLNFHCDGSIVTPSGENQIVISIFNERFTIPRHVKMVPSSTNDEEMREQIIDGKSGIFRQVECSVFLSPKAAKDLISGIQEVIKFLEDQSAEEDEA